MNSQVIADFIGLMLLGGIVGAIAASVSFTLIALTTLALFVSPEETTT